MSLGAADSQVDSTPRPSFGDEPAQDWRWLAGAVVAALLFHFGWTVPWGPFEESPRNRVRSHEAFAALARKYEARGFEGEPEKKDLARAMAFNVERALGLARTRLMAAGHRHWLTVSDLACHSTRCRFSVCETLDFPGTGANSAQATPPAALEDPLQQALQGFELSHEPAWTLARISGSGCPRFEVRFLQLPRRNCLMTLR